MGFGIRSGLVMGNAPAIVEPMQLPEPKRWVSIITATGLAGGYAVRLTALPAGILLPAVDTAVKLRTPLRLRRPGEQPITGPRRPLRPRTSGRELNAAAFGSEAAHSAHAVIVVVRHRSGFGLRSIGDHRFGGD